MKILFVTLCAVDLNTSAMMRNNALIKGFIENGHQVDILTIPSSKINPFYDETNIYENNNVEVFKYLDSTPYGRFMENETNIIGKLKKTVLPVFRYIYHKTNIFDNTIYIAKKIDISILKNNKYDYVVSSSDPKSSHVAVETLINKGLNYSKWIQYWGDPFAIDIAEKSLIPKFYIRKIEKRILSKADKIIYVSPLTLKKQEAIYSEYIKKMTYLPVPYFKKKILKNTRSNSLKLGYFGDYYSNIRDIMPLYETAKNKETKLKLVIAGNSNLNLKSDENTLILPRITREKVEDFEESCDVLVCVLNSRGTQMPGKIYHYAATNKPILILLDGDEKEELKEHLENYNRFLLCNNDVESIGKIISELKKNIPEFSPSPFFEPKLIAKKFLSLHDE